MPLYQYKCSHCGHQDDHLEKVQEGEIPPKTCPKCGKETYEREKVPSTTAFHLKGGGWFKDGY